MASPIRQVQDKGESNAGASRAHRETSQATPEQSSHRYDSVLAKVFAEVSGDPARLRSLLDAMASRNPRLDIVLAEPIARATKRARTILELEQMLHLERTIKHVETPPVPPADKPHSAGRKPALSGLSHGHAPSPMTHAHDAGPIGMQAEAPIQGPYAMRFGIRSFLQVTAATVIGAAVFLGISAWVHWVRPVATQTARVSPPRLPPGEILLGTAETVGSAQARRIEPPAALPNRLPFPGR